MSHVRDFRLHVIIFAVVEMIKYKVNTESSGYKDQMAGTIREISSNNRDTEKSRKVILLYRKY